jgi:hypothetical protein
MRTKKLQFKLLFSQSGVMHSCKREKTASLSLDFCSFDRPVNKAILTLKKAWVQSWPSPIIKSSHTLIVLLQRDKFASQMAVNVLCILTQRPRRLVGLILPVYLIEILGIYFSTFPTSEGPTITRLRFLYCTTLGKALLIS